MKCYEKMKNKKNKGHIPINKRRDEESEEVTPSIPLKLKGMKDSPS